MIRHWAAVGSNVATRLLDLRPSRFEDVIYRDELDRLVKDNSMLEVVQTLTRAQPPGWTGYARRIDTEMLREVAWPADQRNHAPAAMPAQERRERPERHDRGERGERPMGGGGGKKPTPPEQTNAENFYYQKQMQSRTPMVIVLRDGEEIHGSSSGTTRSASTKPRFGRS